MWGIPTAQISNHIEVILTVASRDYDASFVADLVSAHRRVNRHDNALNLDERPNCRTPHRFGQRDAPGAHGRTAVKQP
jgi:hypothetical protein